MATVMVYYQWLVVQQKHATKNLVFEVVQWGQYKFEYDLRLRKTKISVEKLPPQL